MTGHVKYDKHWQNDVKRDRENGQVNTVVKRCELCMECSTYNEDRQIWCHKKKKEVNDLDAENCKYFNSWD